MRCEFWLMSEHRYNIVRNTLILNMTKPEKQVFRLSNLQTAVQQKLLSTIWSFFKEMYADGRRVGQTRTQSTIYDVTEVLFNITQCTVIGRRLTLWLKLRQKYGIYQKMFQIKIVQNSISYKKVNGRICLISHNVLQWESRFTSGLNTAENTVYIERCFKWNLLSVKFLTKKVSGPICLSSQGMELVGSKD